MTTTLRLLAAAALLSTAACDDDIIHDFGYQGLGTTVLAVDRQPPASGVYAFDLLADGIQATYTVRLDPAQLSCRRSLDPPCRTSVTAGSRVLAIAVEQQLRGAPVLWTWFESKDGEFLDGPRRAAIQVSRDGRFLAGYELAPSYYDEGVRGDSHYLSTTTLMVE